MSTSKENVAAVLERIQAGRHEILGCHSNVTVETLEDAQAVLRACLYGRLEQPDVLTAKGEIQDSRRDQVIHGRVVVYAGERYKDGGIWEKTRKKNGFQIYRRKDQPDMLKSTKRFQLNAGTGTVTIVAYQVTDGTLPRASSIPAPDPMDEPLPLEPISTTPCKERPGKRSRVPDNEDKDENEGVSINHHDVDPAENQIVSGRVTTTTNLDGSRVFKTALTWEAMLNPVNE